MPLEEISNIFKAGSKTNEYYCSSTSRLNVNWSGNPTPGSAGSPRVAALIFYQRPDFGSALCQNEAICERERLIFASS